MTAHIKPQRSLKDVIENQCPPVSGRPLGTVFCVKGEVGGLVD